MRLAYLLLALALLSVAVDALAPAVVGILVTLLGTVLSVLVKFGLKKLLERGVPSASKKQSESLQKIAKRVVDREVLSNNEMELLIKGLLMRQMVDRIYNVDYNCTWSTKTPDLELVFHFSFPGGVDVNKLE